MSSSRRVPGVIGLFFLSVVAGIAQPSLPSTIRHQTITSPEGADIYVRSGGSGPVVLLIHGYGDTGDMWGPLASVLARTHTVIVPDLRGMGRSSHPAGGYDKRTQAADLRAVVQKLGHDRTAVVGHDIGNMVAYAYAARYSDRVDRLVVMDARGTRSSASPRSGTSPSADQTQSGSSRGGSASSSTGSGTSSRRIPRRSTRRHARTTRGFTRAPAGCAPVSRSSPRSLRMPKTTRCPSVRG